MGRQKREVFDELHGNGEAIYSGGKETELGSCTGSSSRSTGGVEVVGKYACVCRKRCGLTWHAWVCMREHGDQRQLMRMIIDDVQILMN